MQRDYDGTPMVTDMMADETSLALARVLRQRNEGFIQMNLVTGDRKHDRAHYEQVAEVSGRPLLFNAVIAVNSDPEMHRGILRWLRSCHERGLRVYGQGVTTDAGMNFTFADWNLFDDVAAWCEATTGSIEDRLMKLSDLERRSVLRKAKPRAITNDLADIIVVEVQRPELKHLESRSLRDIGTAMGKHPVDVMLDVAVEDGLRTEFFAPALNTRIDLQREVVADPYVIPGVSDGGAHTKFFTGGRYPTEFLINYVRDNDVLSLEDAHWRLSTLPAYCAGFLDRGLLREGYAADLVIYDLDRLGIGPLEVAHDLPAGEWRRVQKAVGYRYILVNGVVTLADGRATGVTPGQLLRGGSSSDFQVRVD